MPKRTDREVLMAIGNIIGAPTMHYSPEHENKELKKRVDHIANIIIEQLGLKVPPVDPEKFRTNPGIKHVDKPEVLE
jgi:hypothetical protein